MKLLLSFFVVVVLVVVVACVEGVSVKSNYALYSTRSTESSPISVSVDRSGVASYDKHYIALYCKAVGATAYTFQDKTMDVIYPTRLDGSVANTVQVSMGLPQALRMSLGEDSFVPCEVRLMVHGTEEVLAVTETNKDIGCSFRIANTLVPILKWGKQVVYTSSAEAGGAAATPEDPLVQIQMTVTDFKVADCKFQLGSSLSLGSGLTVQALTDELAVAMLSKQPVGMTTEFVNNGDQSSAQLQISYRGLPNKDYSTNFCSKVSTRCGAYSNTECVATSSPITSNNTPPPPPPTPTPSPIPPPTPTPTPPPPPPRPVPVVPTSSIVEIEDAKLYGDIHMKFYSGEDVMFHGINDFHIMKSNKYGLDLQTRLVPCSAGDTKISCFGLLGARLNGEEIWEDRLNGGSTIEYHYKASASSAERTISTPEAVKAGKQGIQLSENINLQVDQAGTADWWATITFKNLGSVMLQRPQSDQPALYFTSISKDLMSTEFSGIAGNFDSKNRKNMYQVGDNDNEGTIDLSALRTSIQNPPADQTLYDQMIHRWGYSWLIDQSESVFKNAQFNKGLLAWKKCGPFSNYKSASLGASDKIQAQVACASLGLQDDRSMKSHDFTNCMKDQSINGKGDVVALATMADGIMRKCYLKKTAEDERNCWAALQYTSISDPKCSDVDYCNFHGICEIPFKDSPALCTCAPGYVGAHCETGQQATECSSSNYCSGGGVCKNDKCVCFNGFHGTSCEQQESQAMDYSNQAGMASAASPVMFCSSLLAAVLALFVLLM